MAAESDMQKKLQDQLIQNSQQLATDFSRRLNQAWQETPEAKGGKTLADVLDQQLDIKKEAKLKTK